MNCKFVVIFLIAVCIGSVHNLKTPKIVNGSVGYVPYAASVYHRHGFYVCGGAIISDLVIATTANCAKLFKERDIFVRTGSQYSDQGGTLTEVLQANRHEKFSDDSPDYDIGTLRVYGTLDSQSQAINLAEKEVKDGAKILVSGWGSTEEGGPLSRKLNSVNITKINRNKCEGIYDGKHDITSRMMCGEQPGAGLCEGDTGGPVVFNGELIGIVSFGMECGKPGYPGVFTNVVSPEIKEFLKQMIRGQVG